MPSPSVPRAVSSREPLEGLGSLGHMAEPVVTLKTRKILGVVALGLTIGLTTAGAYGVGVSAAGWLPVVVGGQVQAAVEAEPEGPLTRPQPGVLLAALRIPTCSINAFAEAPELGEFVGVVLDPRSNEVLFARGFEEPIAPASVQKVLTAAAALTTLGPDTTFQTTTWSTDDPEVLILKAGGDLTLSSTPEGSTSVYLGAAKLQDLATRTLEVLAAALPEGESVTIREVVVDLSLWDASDNWRDAWASSARTNGFISRITPLQIDGDRLNPAGVLSQRSGEPVSRAATAFVSALRQAGNAGRFVSISYALTPPNASQVASVSSPPVSALVDYMLKESDNTVAEMLGRQVSVALGFDGSGDSVGEALSLSLASYGIPREGLVLDDASGLSGNNRVTPAFVGSLLAEVYRSDGDLALVARGLPVAGVDGSLKDRFTGENAVATKRVLGKTGSIKGTRSLAGWVSAEDSEDLVFAFFASGEVGDQTRVALETLITGVYRCGANLADF